MKLKKIMFLRKELENAIENHSETKVRKILNNGLDFNFEFQSSWKGDMTPLQFMLKEKFSITFIQEILSLGIDVNFTNNDGEHSLFYVRNQEQVDLLLSHGVNLELKNNLGVSAYSSNHLSSPTLKAYIIHYVKIMDEKRKFDTLLEDKEDDKPSENKKRTKI